MGSRRSLHLAQGGLHQHERKQNVVLDRKRIQQVEVLKDEAKMLSAKLGQVAIRNRRKAHAVEQHISRGGLIQRGKDVQQRGFTAAAGAHDGDKLAFNHLKAHVLERNALPHAKLGIVDLSQSFYLKKRHGNFLRFFFDAVIVRKSAVCNHRSVLQIARAFLRFCHICARLHLRKLVQNGKMERNPRAFAQLGGDLHANAERDCRALDKV